MQISIFGTEKTYSFMLVMLSLCEFFSSTKEYRLEVLKPNRMKLYLVGFVFPSNRDTCLKLKTTSTLLYC